LHNNKTPTESAIFGAEVVEIESGQWQDIGNYERLDKMRTVILKAGVPATVPSLRNFKLIFIPACEDLKGILNLKSLRPAENQGADRKWLLQIQGFLNFQIMGLKRRFLRQSRRHLASTVAAGDKKGKWVQDRLMTQAADWFRHRTFFCSQQGRHLDKLLNEGTILLLRAYLAESKEAITAKKLYLHVSLLFCLQQREALFIADHFQYVGLDDEIDRQRRSVRNNQTGYIGKVLEQFGMTNCRRRYTPMEEGFCKERAREDT
jgi:hypothetical protein